MVKINDLHVTGLRGVKTDLPLSLDGHSILLYGDNGAGKSSISDAFEWYYFDRVEHLSNEEIGRNGIDALRNVFLTEAQVASLTVSFNDKHINATKTLSLGKGKLVSKYSNSTSEFTAYLSRAQEERLILRYADLATFVLASKSEKLKALSDIIGFSEVTAIRATLKSAVNSLRQEMRLKDFDNKISTQQAHIIAHLGQNVTSEAQFVRAVNDLVEPLKLHAKLADYKSIDGLLKKLAKPDDSATIEERLFWTQLGDFVETVGTTLSEIEKQYSNYREKALKIAGDIDTLHKITLENLLAEAQKVLRGNVALNDKCPLCLQPKKIAQLVDEVEGRIQELQVFKHADSERRAVRDSSKGVIAGLHQRLESYIGHKYLKPETERGTRAHLEAIRNALSGYTTELTRDIVANLTLREAGDLILDRARLDPISTIARARLESLGVERKDDKKFDTHSKIVLGKDAFQQVKELSSERKALERQKSTIELVYSEFVKKQKTGLESFLNRFSTDINALYQFMNPGEEVEDIKLVSVEKDDELNGITIEYKFFKKNATPPNRLLSESHLNCLGIAFFLISVEAFNKANRFFIIDDVISSFDAPHRKRFADLLLERYADYQIILLTHEKHWFDMTATQAKRKGWKIGQVKWNALNGTHIEEAPADTKRRIQTRLLVGDTPGLGNDIRKYLEHLLKEIAHNVNVKVDFRFNDVNEDRMSSELLSELKSKLNKQPPSALNASPVLDRLIGSGFLTNKDSHDTTFIPDIHDHKAFWADVESLESLFCCKEKICAKAISVRYFDNVKKEVRCGCGKISYPWRL